MDTHIPIDSMRLRSQTKSSLDSVNNDADSKNKYGRRAMGNMRRVLGWLVRPIRIQSLVLVAVGFCAGILCSWMVGGRSEKIASVPMVILPPNAKQVDEAVANKHEIDRLKLIESVNSVVAPDLGLPTAVGTDADNWRKKYEELARSVDSKKPDDASSQPTISEAGTKKEDLSPHEEASIVMRNKQMEKQHEQLRKQANDSDGVRHKASEEKKPTEETSVETKVFGTLPTSSVWCDGNKLSNRVCKFRNICYSQKYQWFIVKSNQTVLEGVPTREQRSQDIRPGLVEMTTVEDHPWTAWSYDEVSPFAPELKNRKVKYHTDFTILFKRFHSSNIMHALHDDVMPLYHHIRHYVGGFMKKFPYFDIDLTSHRIQFIDYYEVTETYRPFQYLSDLPIGVLSELDEDPELITCFRDATAGVRKLTNWYQYGFVTPQGPIDKFVNGLHVRMVADFYISRLGQNTDDLYTEASDLMLNTAKANLAQLKIAASKKKKSATSSVDYAGEDIIVIMSRTRNRLILNEKALAEHFERLFKHHVVFVRNEDHSFEEQILLMRKAKVVIAMHGSIMIMAMFCRRGTVVLELYPWAVPSKNYTPYRTMANLHGMHLVYRAWENKNSSNSVSHPDWPANLGGLGELTEEERQKVMNTSTVPTHICCVDPYWLYRIYQDTIVDIGEVTDLVLDALQESADLLQRLQTENVLIAKDILPPIVTGPMFQCVGEGRPSGALWIRWNDPWNGAQPDYYVVRLRIDGAENADPPFSYYFANTTELFVTGFADGTGVIFSVKSVVGEEETVYGDEAICTI